MRNTLRRLIIPLGPAFFILLFAIAPIAQPALAEPASSNSTQSEADKACQLGFQKLASHDLSDALSAFERAAALQPDLANAHLGLGITRFLTPGDPKIRPFLPKGSRDVRGAIDSVTEAIRIAPTRAEAYICRAYFILNDRTLTADLDLAFADFEKAFELKNIDPEGPPPTDKARLLFSRETDPEKSDYLDWAKAVRWRKTQLPEALCTRARRVMEKYPADAISDYGKAHQLVPHHAGILVMRAQVRLSQKDISGAKEDVHAALEKAPRMAQAYQVLVRCYLAEENQEAALLTCDHAIDMRAAVFAFASIHEDQPFNIQPADEAKGVAIFYTQIAQIHFQDAQYPEAVDAMNRAIALTPSDSNAYALRAMLQERMKDFDAALADFDKAVGYQGPKTDHTLHLERGLLREKTGDLDGALQDFEIGVRPGLRLVKESLFFTAWYKSKTNEDPAGAIDDYTRAIEKSPKRVLAWISRGDAHLQVYEYAAALSDYEKTIELRGDYGTAHMKHGFVLHLLGRTEDALSSYSRAQTSAFGDATGPNLKDYALLYLGRKDALDDLKQRMAAVLAKKPDDPTALFLTGKITGSDYVARLPSFSQKSRAFYIIAMVHFANGSPEKGRDALKQCVDFDVSEIPEFQLAEAQLEAPQAQSAKPDA